MADGIVFTRDPDLTVVKAPGEVVDDLATPVATIKGSLEVLLKHWEVLDDDRRKRFVRLASEAMDHLVDVVELFKPSDDLEAPRPTEL
jgi:hypothetical protein